MSVENINQSHVALWRDISNIFDDGQTPSSQRKNQPSPKQAKPQDIPSRKAPEAKDNAVVKEGLDNVKDRPVLFSIERLMALLFDLALTQREALRDERMTDANIAQQMGEAQAEDLRDEGAMEVSGAVFSATAQISGAAVVIGGGIGTIKNNNVMSVSNKMMAFQSASQAFGSVGTMSKGGFDYQEKQDEAQKALDDASASQAKSLEESDNDDQKEEQQIIQALVELQDKLIESRHEAVRATA